jgi:hypothetical protein
MRGNRALRLVLVCGLWAAAPGSAQEPKPEDPFAGLEPQKTENPAPRKPRSWGKNFFRENFGFRKEVMSQFTWNPAEAAASRQSVGFEVLKKFSTATATVASFSFQGRLVRRDGYNPAQNEMEGAARPGWWFEYHNFFWDFYNVLNPLQSDEQRSRNVGRFNLRAGRFYVPFGINLQTDTHGTIFQLSNDRSFGFERDWYAGFWGRLNDTFNYDAYYMLGSGYDLKYKGQAGLGALRISLGNRINTERGIEGGVSVLGGERLVSAMTGEGHEAMMGPAVPVKTTRAGLDARVRRAAAGGMVTLTTEFSGGRDNDAPVLVQLYQTEYLSASRRWGVGAQYRDNRVEGLRPVTSVSGEVTWYLKNDVGNSSLHWIKFNVERQTSRLQGPPQTIFAVQYYFYR